MDSLTAFLAKVTAAVPVAERYMLSETDPNLTGIVYGVPEGTQRTVGSIEFTIKPYDYQRLSKSDLAAEQERQKIFKDKLIDRLNGGDGTALHTKRWLITEKVETPHFCRYNIGRANKYAEPDSFAVLMWAGAGFTNREAQVYGAICDTVATLTALKSTRPPPPAPGAKPDEPVF